MAPFLRTLPSRATRADLWASVDALAVETDGYDRLELRHRTKLDAAARARFGAYVAQAKEYYSGLSELDPVAKPLLAYYFALNLTKAFLTAIDPDTTQSANLVHGLSQAFKSAGRYYFQQEGFKADKRGVFRSLASNTGHGFCWPAGTRRELRRVMPYLVEAYDLYADAEGEPCKLLPVADAKVLYDTKQAWLLVEVDRNILRQRNIGPESLTERACVFGNRFRFVSSPTKGRVSYESKRTFKYGKRRDEVLKDLTDLFDASLVVSQRYGSDRTHYLILSERQSLLSQEALTFAVLHHLSNMVRYRPQHVEKLRGTKHFWVFASWVDRACENFLLSLASRITRDEHRIV